MQLLLSYHAWNPEEPQCVVLYLLYAISNEADALVQSMHRMFTEKPWRKARDAAR